MAGSRTLTPLAGLAAGPGLSAALYLYTGSVLFFLFVPFVPVLPGAGGSADRTAPPQTACARCSFRARNPAFEYCPRDGSRLYEDGAGSRMTDRARR